MKRISNSLLYMISVHIIKIYMCTQQRDQYFTYFLSLPLSGIVQF